MPEHLNSNAMRMTLQACAFMFSHSGPTDDNNRQSIRDKTQPVAHDDDNYNTRRTRDVLNRIQQNLVELSNVPGVCVELKRLARIASDAAQQYVSRLSTDTMNDEREGDSSHQRC